MTKEEVIEILSNLNWSAGSVDRDKIAEALYLAIRALNEIPPKSINSCHEDDSVYCEECPHHRSTSWCALAIPHHEPVSELYKIRMEGFWEGVHCAEDDYNSLMEIIEEYDIESKEIVKCDECIHNSYCLKTISRLKIHDEYNEYWAENVEFCSKGKRRENLNDE